MNGSPSLRQTVGGSPAPLPHWSDAGGGRGDSKDRLNRPRPGARLTAYVKVPQRGSRFPLSGSARSESHAHVEDPGLPDSLRRLHLVPLLCLAVVRRHRTTEQGGWCLRGVVGAFDSRDGYLHCF